MHLRTISKATPAVAGYDLQVWLDTISQIISVILDVSDFLSEIFGIDVSEKINPTS